MYTYILIYDNETADREAMKSHLNSLPEILSWRFDIPNSFFIYSTETASRLTELLSSRLPNYKCFLFVEMPSNKQGYLKRETWNFINQTAFNDRQS